LKGKHERRPNLGKGASGSNLIVVPNKHLLGEPVEYGAQRSRKEKQLNPAEFRGGENDNVVLKR